MRDVYVSSLFPARPKENSYDSDEIKYRFT